MQWAMDEAVILGDRICPVAEAKDAMLWEHFP